MRPTTFTSLVLSVATLLVLFAGCVRRPAPDQGGGNTSDSQAVINSPRDGSKIAGTLFFSVQPFNPSEVESVSFKAGDADLGTDTTAEDGFKVFLAAKDYPAGALKLSATIKGKNGKTSTQTITVDNVPSPPSSATVTRDGAVLGTVEENGALSTLVIPAGANEGAEVSFEAKTKAEVKAATGVDYDALGVTFLGAQEISSSEPVDQTLMVASGGFGPQVQPGQAVVNYRIAPDADGDGVGELVVVNSASVAPNGDVVSDPVSAVQMQSGTVNRSSARRGLATMQENALEAAPGEVLEIKVSGMNPYAPFGNLVLIYSPSRNEYAVNYATILPATETGGQQTALASLPWLPAGDVELFFVNLSSGVASKHVDVKLNALEPLGTDLRAAYKAFFDRYVALFENSSILNQEEKDKLVSNITSARASINIILDEFEGKTDPAAEQILRDLTVAVQMAQNIPMEMYTPNALYLQQNCDLSWSDFVGTGLAAAGLAAAFFSGPAAVTVGIGASVASFGFSAVTGGYDGVSSGGSILDAAAVSSGISAVGASEVGYSRAVQNAIGNVGKAIGVAAVAYNAAALVKAWDNYERCKDREPPGPGGGGGGTTGMGSAAPSGGSGAGSGGAGSGGSGSSLRAQQAEDPLKGRIQVKVFVNGRPLPFTGLTDAGGYFYIPMIPAGQPFRAVAYDKATGDTRTFEGVGPELGDSVYMFFDFISEDSGSSPIPKASLDSNTQGTLAAGETDLYTFSANAGQLLSVGFVGVGEFTNVTRLSLVAPSGGIVKTLDTRGGARETGVIALEETGVYTVSIGGSNGGGGEYIFGLAEIEPPQPTSLEALASTLSGTLEVLGDHQFYSFSAGAEDLYKFTLSHPASSQVKALLQIRRPQTAPFYARGVLAKANTIYSARRNDATAALQLPETGEYVLEVSAASTANVLEEASGTWEVSSFAPVYRPVAIGDLVKGEVGVPGQLFGYTFTAGTGQTLFFDTQGTLGSGLAQLDWRVTSANGDAVFQEPLFRDPGLYTLQAGGTYTVIVGVDNDVSTGSYAFRLWDVPPPDRFSVAPGVLVAEGSPGAGAGSIETPGVQDIYTLNVSAGQTVFFDTIGTLGSGMAQLNWRAVTPGGETVFDEPLFRDPGLYTLPEAGSYIVTVGENVDLSGPYSFRVWEVPPPDVFVISIGDTVSEGSPGAGAGDIEVPGAKDIYTFAASAGQEVVFETIGVLGSGMAQLNWRVEAPSGALLFDEPLFRQPGAYTFSETGTYKVTVGENVDLAGVYSFRIRAGSE